MGANLYRAPVSLTHSCHIHFSVKIDGKSEERVNNVSLSNFSMKFLHRGVCQKRLMVARTEFYQCSVVMIVSLLQMFLCPLVLRVLVTLATHVS